MADIVDMIFEDHQWLRQHFLYLDYAASTDELRAVWEPLADRLDTHAQAEEEVFYPRLLKEGDPDDAEDETDDAIDDHNKIRDAVRAARTHRVGTKAWFEAVGTARTENGKHLDEEEREALPDFIKNSSAEERHQLAMQWARFYAAHRAGAGVDTDDRDPQQYIESNR